MVCPQDETFPELGVGSTEACDDQESVCSNEREGDAFPKAFDRDRVTPTTLQKSNAGESLDSTSGAGAESITSPKSPKDYSTSATSATTSTPKTETTPKDRLDTSEITRELRSLEERRRSLLDHHWAVPSKDRSTDDDSVDDSTTASNATSVVATAVSSSSASTSTAPTANSTAVGNLMHGIGSISIDNESIIEKLTKENCHDSGIDIRDPVLPAVTQTKKVYSDADIVLSSDWVPPITIAPTDFNDTPSRTQASSSSSGLGTSSSLDHTIGRKKTSSVSFSVDDNNEQNQSNHHHSTSSDKSSDKKNKMLKRLSYPLTWVEGLTGDVKQDSTESAPNTGDSNQSVFSKVFSR